MITVSREIRSERRPFKSPIKLGTSGVNLQDFIQANPGHQRDTPTRRRFATVNQIGGGTQSPYITTRCYSPAGVQLWDGDHGNTVFALAVGPGGVVYQSGLGGLVTAMQPRGEIIWTQDFPAVDYSYGIAVGVGGYVYCSFTRESVGPMTGYVAKLGVSTGVDLLHLPYTGFYAGSGNIQWGRVRTDAAGNVYAIFRTIGGVVKWVSDAEFWMLSVPSYDTGLNVTGLGVASDGRVFTTNDPTRFGPSTATGFYSLDTSVNNLPPPTSPAYLARATVTTDIFDSYPERYGYRQTGVSPSGRAISQNDHSLRIEELTATVDPDAPTITDRAPCAVLGGSVFRPYTAMAINDDGDICYSVPRGAGLTTSSHMIQDSAGMGFALDHGGAIFDAVVLPNGNTIVAGDRVRRIDFP